MSVSIDSLPRTSLGLYPTPFYKLQNISRKYGRNIWIKRDDLCGVALGGNKVRKLEFLLADAVEKGVDTVFTTGGAQSNHAMLTAACASRLGMKAVLILKKRGETDFKGNLILNQIYGAEVQFMDTDDYEDIYEEMRRQGEILAASGHKSCYIPCGGSSPLGGIGYAACSRELEQEIESNGLGYTAIVSATGSGGTSAGLMLGRKLFSKNTKVYGVAVDTDPFETIVPEIAEQSAQILGETIEWQDDDFTLLHHVGNGYAIPNAEDTPYIQELARLEGILLDPVYTGKAWTGFLEKVQEGYFDKYDDLIFVHTGGAAALFAMDLG